MLIRNAFTALALIAGIAAAPVVVQAADEKPAAEQSGDVKAALAKLKKQVGSGEISAKEYQARKAALLAGQASDAKAKK